MPVAVFLDQSSLMRAAAEIIVDLASRAIAERGRFSWALSGGRTPERLYALLASPEYVTRVDWERVHFFWGDERCVPPDHADSNYRLAKEALLDVVKAPAGHVHRMLGESEPTQAASGYEHTLRRSFALPSGERLPRFDLILLGMGADGHTASLFPGTPALLETTRWVVANAVQQLHAVRLTLTLPIINAAARIVFLVTGADKAVRLAQVLAAEPLREVLPARLVRPRDGTPDWLVDNDAGALLGTLKDTQPKF